MNSKMPIYYKCNMTKSQHMLAYIVCSVIASVIIWLFYRIWIISIIIGFCIGFPFEKMYAESTVKKRQKQLRIQFKDFLSSMVVAVRAGNVEKFAIRAALNDLRMAYNSKADIICELENIILQSEKGGIELKFLFEDFGERSGIEDISNFATIYSVIEGKSDRFGDVLSQTEQIIRDKIEIEMEIDTTITSAKSETMTMLIMPVIIVIAMSAMGSELTTSLFNTMSGHLAATVALILFGISFVLAIKNTNIEV